MERIEQDNRLNESPTSQQRLAIARLCSILRIKEPLEEGPSNRIEARNLLYQLRAQLRLRNRRR
jgi:hypothetical protein